MDDGRGAGAGLSGKEYRIGVQLAAQQLAEPAE